LLRGIAVEIGPNGWLWIRGAIDEAVDSGSGFVAPKRVREICRRWMAEGLPVEVAGMRVEGAGDRREERGKGEEGRGKRTEDGERRKENPEPGTQGPGTIEPPGNLERTRNEEPNLEPRTRNPEPYPIK